MHATAGSDRASRSRSAAQLGVRLERLVDEALEGVQLRARTRVRVSSGIIARSRRGARGAGRGSPPERIASWKVAGLRRAREGDSLEGVQRRRTAVREHVAVESGRGGSVPLVHSEHTADRRTLPERRRLQQVRQRVAPGDVSRRARGGPASKQTGGYSGASWARESSLAHRTITSWSHARTRVSCSSRNRFSRGIAASRHDHASGSGRGVRQC